MPLTFQTGSTSLPDPSTGQPQPSQAAPEALRPAHTSVLGAAVVLVALTTAVYAWKGARDFSWNRPSRVPSVSAHVKPNAPATVERRLFASPMTALDAERIRALPAQDQAEELLERALAHDETAREIFDRNVREWTGHLRMTPRMRQLETRLPFSSDLRVRFADADVNLALEGWACNEGSSGTLIARAQAEPKSRSYAVYYLGMLGGRGADYQRIHQVLVNYAQHDPDPIVRQWAVEGMRYLGKDEALDDLFQSFTHDPSLSVRDRAGCNVSDCGNFTRVQRMRMVPRLIELASDPATTPQMRNWSFLALHEITDENLPSDASAWAAWYSTHGAEKLAQYAAQPWWQIRGDE